MKVYTGEKNKLVAARNKINKEFSTIKPSNSYTELATFDEKTEVLRVRFSEIADHLISKFEEIIQEYSLSLENS